MILMKKETYENLKRKNEKLKQKLNAYVVKEKGRAYIAEGKSWVDTDSNEEEEYVNLALMADFAEESPQSSQVTELTTIDMSVSEYKSTVHELTLELYNVHNSMLAYKMENDKLVLKSESLTSRNEELELLVVGLEELKKNNEYLENKKEILDSQRFKSKTSIGFDYSKLNSKKHSGTSKINMFVLEKVPYVIKDAVSPLFTESVSEPLDEVSLLINEELIAEDREKVEESPKTPKAPVSKAKPIIDLGAKVDRKEPDTLKKPEPIVNPKTSESAKVKTKKNMNGKVGVNKKSDFASSSSTSRKLCNNYNSAAHLTHACTKDKVESIATFSMPAMPNMPSFHEPCGVVGCMQCAFVTMSEYFKAYHATASTCTDTKTNMGNEHTQAKTVVPLVSKSNISDKTSTEKKSVKVKTKPVKGKVRKEKIMWILNIGCSRHMTGEKSLLTGVVEKVGPIVTFGDDSKGFTKGYGNLKIGNVIIENISLMEGLKHNLLSISQFFDRGYNVDFRTERCLITHRKDEKLALQGVRKVSQVTQDSEKDTIEIEKNDNVCTLCKEYTSEALTYLDANKMQEEIIHILHGSCSMLHSLKEEGQILQENAGFIHFVLLDPTTCDVLFWKCLVLVYYYAPLFFLEISSIEPADFCQKVNLCEQVALNFQHTSKHSCELCHYAIAEALIKLKDLDTELDIIEVLLKACKAVKGYETKEQPSTRPHMSEVVKALDYIVSQPYLTKSPPAESTSEIPVIS
ncbi:hypothetical protein AgCh_000420 [Apium graveolens]